MSSVVEKIKQKGFSLVELMVVVAIIGILASLAVPRFQVFQAKARQAEAKTNLSSIYTLEMSYQAQWDTYVVLAATGKTTAAAPVCNTNTLGFVISDCAKVRYGYTVASGTIATMFTGTAITPVGAGNLVFPGCATADKWTIDHSRTLSLLTDASTACK